MDVAWFRSFFGGKGIQIAPEGSSLLIRDVFYLLTSTLVYDAESEIVVATLNNTQAGELFGVSKIKNGNRMVTFHLARMVVILYPRKSTAEVFVTV
jgi:hypothetical protein